MNDLFADQELIFDADTVKEWLSLLRKRIGHNRPDQIEFRKLEEQLILELAQKAKGQAEVLFEKVLLTQEMLGPPNEELDQINKKIAKIWRKELAAQILNKFTQLGGLDTYNDPNKHHEEKRLLFSTDSEFDQEGLAKLVDRAFSDEGLQANFLLILKLFFRSVSNDNHNHLQVTRSDLLLNKSLAKILWQGATSRPISLNRMYSLLEYRQKYQAEVGDTNLMDIPNWVKEEAPDMYTRFNQETSQAESAVQQLVEKPKKWHYPRKYLTKLRETKCVQTITK